MARSLLYVSIYLTSLHHPLPLELMCLSVVPIVYAVNVLIACPVNVPIAHSVKYLMVSGVSE